ncbi:MAG: hypothetical protein ACRDJW_01175 [Thermomicrobiales bacterium]
MIDVGSDWQLFIDRYLVADERNACLKVHPPTLRETIWVPERPWEENTSWFPNVMQDGNRYRMWYRAESSEQSDVGWDLTAYLESDDGIHWERPNLGLIEFNGSRANNLVWTLPDTVGTNLCVFRDANPAAPADERYKAIAKAPKRGGIVGLVSADGIHWRPVQSEPIIPPPESDPMFDSPNIAFWDPWRRQYVAYTRGWIAAPPEALSPDYQYDRPQHAKTRTVRRATSTDFRNWTALDYLDLDLAAQPREQFYTNATIPYERARNVYFMFPMRYVHERNGPPEWSLPGLSDVSFLSSRDGIHWDRSFRDAWLRPGLDDDNWHERSMAIGFGLVQTGPKELSLYLVDRFRTPRLRFVRAALRLDGFGSVNAPFAGGKITTPPLTFQGVAMEINYSTSIMGAVQVEIQDEAGNALPGYGLDDSATIYGDELDRIVTWQGNGNVSAVAGRPVRLRFALTDADLYAFRFQP